VRTVHYCPSCGAELPDYAHFCGHCGHRHDAATTIDVTTKRQRLPSLKVKSLDVSTAGSRNCPSCGAGLPDYAHFCGHCGHRPDATTTIDVATTMRRLPPLEVKSLDVSTSGSRISIFYYKVQSKLPLPLQRASAAVLARARDPKPEDAITSDQKAVGSQAIVWGWLPALSLTSALAMLLLAYAYTSARYGATEVDNLFWLGVLLMFAPPIARLISPVASRFERMSLLCITATCFYLINVVGSGFTFSGNDPWIHARTADNIIRSGHLFSENSLLPASPFYPGLEIVTNAVSRLSGLDTFTAGTIIIGLARLVMILSLFAIYEQITKSARMAGIATIIYMTNPHFLFFDAGFSYESLALPLAIFVLFATLHYEILNRNRGWITLTALIPLAAVVVTHHMTSFILAGLLLLWMVIYALQHRTPLLRSPLVKIALFGISAPLAWISLKGNPVVGYLTSYFGTALDELGHILAGTSSERGLFTTYAGQPTPLWERIVALGSVCFLLLGLPFGLLCLWQRYRRSAFACVLGIAALFYPVTHIFRFTNFGSEITDRAAAFLFIPLGFVLAIFITQFWPTRWLSWKQTTLLTCVLSVVIVGGSILGAGQSWDFLPGPYLVAADQRSIEPEGIQAAIWAPSYLGFNNRIATDRTNGLLMSTDGNQNVVTSLSDNVDVSQVFFSPSLGPEEVSILRQAKVRYLVVDLRLSTALPSLGIYFEPGEPDSFHHTKPISLQALTKFNNVAQVNRVFDSGDIVIYDVGGLINAPEEP
jgi:hypothetical protein